ncbi:MAG: hypothetical protein ACXVBD_02030 [Pseudobdellovibrio sp.]
MKLDFLSLGLSLIQKKFGAEKLSDTFKKKLKRSFTACFLSFEFKL